MQITLREVKNVKELTFKIPGPGVWILTGWNGSGKSTLLAALYRIGFNGAFQYYFKAGALTSNIDRYENSSVEYELNGEIVTYRYGGQRWRASPRRNSELLNDFGFSEVLYLEANSTRIEPQQNEIKSNRVYACDTRLIEAMETVLGDPKWRELKYVYTQRGGRGKLRAFLIQFKVGARNRYFSEQSFSLGELCVLRVLLKVLDAKPNSLLLIDEVEMALHPEAQMRLMETIKQFASTSMLTVIFSTHSSTIIKHCSRDNLIYLKSNAGQIEVIEGAYPARILGDISSAGELSVDFLFYVEDEQARILLDTLIERYYASLTSLNTAPRWRVVPVGGYSEVIAMLANTNGLIPTYVKRAAFLDADAQTEVSRRLAAAQEPFSSNHRRGGRHIHYLPWTPEVGLCSYLEDDLLANNEARTALEQAFPTATVAPHSFIQNAAYRAITDTNHRDQAKKRRTYVVKQIANNSGLGEPDVTKRLYTAFANWTYRASLGPLKQLLCPELNRHT